MGAYIMRRLLLLIPTVFLVSIICFFSVRFIPGDVIDLMVVEMAQESGLGTELTTYYIREALGLDVPIHIQYVRWIGAVLQGDLGKSLWTGDPVAKEIIGRLPVSLELLVMAISTGLLIAIPIGIYSAVRQEAWTDYISRSIAILFIALPTFWMGTLVMVYPSLWWRWSPPMEYTALYANPVENLAQMMLPALILGSHLSGVTMRMTRTMMLEVLRQDYIRTAWAKGLRERTITLRHALKNALIPVVSIVGVQMAILIGGSLVMEQIFCLPGIGRLFLEALTKRDYTVISGVNLAMATSVLIINLIVDLSYAYLDPRVQYK